MEVPVGLLRRNKQTETAERCPHCQELIPEDADTCAMCGADLRPLRSSGRGRQDKPDLAAAHRATPGSS
jgi:hypothetical protein